MQLNNWICSSTVSNKILYVLFICLKILDLFVHVKFCTYLEALTDLFTFLFALMFVPLMTSDISRSLYHESSTPLFSVLSGLSDGSKRLNFQFSRCVGFILFLFFNLSRPREFWGGSSGQDQHERGQEHCQQRHQVGSKWTRKLNIVFKTTNHNVTLRTQMHLEIHILGPEKAVLPLESWNSLLRNIILVLSCTSLSIKIDRKVFKINFKW